MAEVFPNWREHVVRQRDVKNGCIPTGYEILIRAAGRANEVEIDSFQEDFDFGADANFKNISQAVTIRYPHVTFVHRSFDTGAEKLAILEDRFQNRRPTLIALPKAVQRLNTLRDGLVEVAHCCHIVPIVKADAQTITVFWGMAHDERELRKYSKDELLHFHDDHRSGIDIAYLD